MTFTELYNDCLLAARDVTTELENYGGDAYQLITERAYSMAVETYHSVTFEIVDAMRGDGELFTEAQRAAEDIRHGSSDFWSLMAEVAYQGVLSLMIEQLGRMGVEV